MKLTTDISLLKQNCKSVSVAEGLRIGRSLWLFLKNFNLKHGSGAAIGLAASQLGLLKKVCILHIGGKQLTLINPKIIEHSTVKIPYKEKCLSFPGQQVLTYRWPWVTIACQNWATPVKFGQGNLLAAIAAQHEVAHTYGKLIFDFSTEEYPNGNEWDSWTSK